MRARKKPVILIGVQDTCNIFAALCSGFRAIGCDAYFVNLGGVSLKRDSTELPVIPRFYHSAYKRFSATRTLSRLNPLRYWTTGRMLMAYALFLGWIVARVDAAIFKSGESFSDRGWDMRLLRKLGRRIIIYYVGSDSRPPYLAGVSPDTVDLETLYKRVIETRKALRRAEMRADVVVVNPLSAQFHQKPICIDQVINNSLDPERIARAQFAASDTARETSIRPLRIVHAPSSAALKGTDRIRAAVANLAQKGYRVEYIELSGRPNDEVLATLAGCDIAIDQLYSDCYGGMFAHEACALGKPVIVCGYGATELARIVPKWARLPSVFGHPDELEVMLERLVSDHEYRRETAEQMRRYAPTMGAAAVAARFLDVIENRAPKEWYFDPASISYVEGVAGPAENVATIVRRFVDRFGPSALGLDDKPALRDRLLTFAGVTTVQPETAVARRTG